MNDEELKTCLVKLRVPPCRDVAQSEALNRALTTLSRCEKKPLCWTWRDWLWPSPLAWGALAGIWVVVLSHEVSTAPRVEPSSAGIVAKPLRSPFYAHAEYQELLRQFQQSPNAR